ncbi:hypothetical protein [Thermus islandicus]|uniref:hypothetical protein n=1 Tax=Thermus islandicus TaxID=540988 RepID=UPI0003B46762|nr:hypothetical protein [Thermus islandicus]
MSLDDLLGLLFLLFFVILPALQGLSRRGRPPTLPEDLPLPEPFPKPKSRPRPKPKPLPSPEPKRAEAPSRPTLPPPSERRVLEARPQEPQEEPPPKPARKKLLRTDRESILKGVIWHEILKRPKGF